MKRKVFIILGLLIALVPLGLLTDYSAWGEWENEYYKKVLGFIPQGIENAKGIKPIIPDYSIAGLNETVSYYISAIIGLFLLFAIYYIFTKLVSKKVVNDS